MTKEPFLPLFFGDFLASTAEWEGEERALYLLLLCYQWSLGSLPEEPRRVCKLVGWEWQLFERCWVAIAPKFRANAGRLLNQRLEQHREKSHQISEKRAAAGSLGGKASQAIARVAREQLPHTTEAFASNLLDPPSSPSHPIPSSPKKREETPRRAARGTPQGAGEVSLHESLPKSDWDEWLEFRRKRRWPVDTTTLRKQLNVLVTFDTETQRQIIAKSINAGWQGIFPPKGRPATKPRESLTVEELEVRETRRLSGEGRTAMEIASELAMPLDHVQEILRNGHARQ